MAQLRGMRAQSLDGFVADSDGGVGFLDDFAEVDWGFDSFLAQIGTVVMGRLTYLHMLDLAPDWPYPGKRGIVLGRGMSPPLRGQAEPWTAGLPALIAHLSSLDDGDVWVVGGPGLQGALLAEGALDRLELCIVPRLLGRGIRLFPEGPAGPRLPDLVGVRHLSRGMVMLDYRFGTTGGRGR